MTALIGVGGMGEVYRATDTNLKRAVAIKVLPQALASDVERLARFHREAEVLAALNHPNIAHIHGLERADTMSALVMELVEGPTLADRIAQGPIPLDEALPIASQMAEALEAAHEQGIIHRDLKPANIKVREDGVVKVLDFGLAKLTQPAGTGPRRPGDLSQSPTITSPALMTGIGVILGTAAYMAPEQAKGRDADKRSDIWAFGCVLYEMLTGRRAFGGEDMTDVLGAVVRLEPTWVALPADVPPAVRTLIQRCLVKDRRHRLSEIATAKFVLGELGNLGAAHTADEPSAAARRPRWRRALPAATAATLTAIIVGTGAWVLSPRPAPPVVTRFSFMVPQAQRLVTGQAALAVSPDGTQLVYAAAGQLYRRSVSEWESHPIVGTNMGGVEYPAFSPDGASLAFHARGTIHRIDAKGGVAVTVCPTPLVFGMTWHASGIVFGGSSGIFRCPPNGGTPEQLATVADDEQAYGPRVLPDGQAVIFTVAKDTDAADRWDTALVVVQSLTSRERRTLVTGGSDARYVSTGHLLYARRGVVLAKPFDPVSQQVSGTEVPVIAGVARFLNNALTGVAHFDVSATGSLLYVPGPTEGPSTERTIVFADRDGRLTPLATPSKPYVHARASRDGARLALDSDDGKEAIVWIYELKGTSPPIKMTFGGRNRFPIWSPDSRRVAFQSDREGDRAIFVQAIDRTGLQRLTKPEKGYEHVPESWSRDGHLSFSVVRGSTHSLWVLSTADNTSAPFGTVQSSSPIGSSFSPDGKWIAYCAGLQGGGSSQNAGVFVQPFPATGTIHQAPKLERDLQPLWSWDGSELFYVPSVASGRLAAVLFSTSTQSGVTFGSPQSLPGAIVGGKVGRRSFDVLRDGRFVGLIPRSAEDLSAAGAQEVRFVFNWTEELKRLVPAR